jgi:hypothetical protein
MDNIVFARLVQEWAAKQPGMRITPPNYLKWETIAGLAQHCGSRLKGVSDEDQGWDFERIFCSALAEYHLPPRYASEELTEAWLHTATPKLTWNRPDALPGYVACFPRTGAIVDQLTTELTEFTAVINAALIMNFRGGLCVVPIYTFGWDGKEGKIVTWDVLKVEPDVDYNNPSLPRKNQLLAKLAINSWYTHAYEPELITTDTVKPAGGIGFGRAKEARSPIAPTWIGRNFKIRRESSPAPGQETGIKVRPHWRSGHWHTVRHGKGREQERLQWYRPVYVNADTAA